MNETEVLILGNSQNNATEKTILGDFQEYSTTIEIGDYSFEITKRLFINYIEPLINMDGYLRIGDLLYKVLKIQTFITYQEFWLYLLDRQSEVV
ncbi:MAG: hypothetical protein APF84_12400 [Gracilibacter sp. BRH_c7a]|nr:MAG: hypothetical protein APF84_12400 [Gracilibacter sp. BRH_c7a]